MDNQTQFPMDKKLTCHRCGHVWTYRGANAFYCSCPHCKTTVPIRPPTKKIKKAEPIILPAPTPKVPVENLTAIQLPHIVTTVKSDQDLSNITNESKDPIVKKDKFDICLKCVVSYPGCIGKCKLLKEAQHE